MRKGSACLLFLLVLLSVASCVRRLPSFDEAKWRSDVEGEKISDLYAPHDKDGRYFNPWMPMESRGFWVPLQWRLSSRGVYTPEEETYRPAVVPKLKERILSMPAGDFIAWVGHNTFLMRLNGEYWLTDPIFSQRALLPKRVTPPALSAEDVKELPGKLNVVISHNHYDHFDKSSIRDLPEKTRVFVPMGLKESVEHLDKENVLEMDWWQTIDCGNGIRLACLPAQHWSRRISQGTNRTLWASFMIMTPSVTIYIGGDSGYFIGYREIGRLYGNTDFQRQARGNPSSEHGEREGEAPAASRQEGATRAPVIDYALLPITAYHPRWFMHYAHMNVSEAIDAFQDLGARHMIPTQWGTFHLGNEPVGYAALDLKRTIKEKGLDPSMFIIMDIGQLLPIAAK